MKKAGWMVLLLTALFLVSQAANAQVRVGLKLTGGLNYLGGGDLNKGGQAWADFYKLSATGAGYSSQGKFTPVHWGLDFGGEFMIFFTPQLGLGLGAGYISGAKKSTITFTQFAHPTVTFTNEPKATAIPLKLTFYYHYSAAPGFNIVFQAGAGL